MLGNVDQLGHNEIEPILALQLFTDLIKLTLELIRAVLRLRYLS